MDVKKNKWQGAEDPGGLQTPDLWVTRHARKPLALENSSPPPQGRSLKSPGCEGSAAMFRDEHRPMILLRSSCPLAGPNQIEAPVVQLSELSQKAEPLLNVLLDRVSVDGPRQVPGDCGSQELPGGGKGLVEDGEVGKWRWVSPEVHCHLYSLEQVQLQVVLTEPADQLLHFLSRHHPR